jgi:hypothetical protein
MSAGRGISHSEMNNGNEMYVWPSILKAVTSLKIDSLPIWHMYFLFKVIVPTLEVNNLLAFAAIWWLSRSWLWYENQVCLAWCFCKFGSNQRKVVSNPTMGHGFLSKFSVAECFSCARCDHRSLVSSIATILVKSNVYLCTEFLLKRVQM